MASAESEPITGVWGGAPSRVQGQRALPDMEIEAGKSALCGCKQRSNFFGCKWLYLQVCILISAPKTALFRATHILPKKNQRAISWELEINFSHNSAAALRRWGRQVNNYCVAYFLNILCCKYCRNRSTCRHCSKMKRGLFFY